MTTITRHRTVDAPIGIVWDVVTDHDLYAEAAPNLSAVEIVEGKGEGMIRRCVDTNDNTWTESCTRWEDGRAYAVSVDVSNSDFHRRLFNRFEGEWSVDARDDGVRITITFEFEPRYGAFGVLISTLLRYKAPGIIERIFDRWEAEIRTRTAADATRDTAATGHPRGVNALYR